MKKIYQKWHTYCGEENWYVIAEGGDIIARIPHDEQGEELAKFISSAPDTFEALKNLRHTVDKLIQDGTIALDHPGIVKITMQANEGLWAMNKALVG